MANTYKGTRMPRLGINQNRHHVFFAKDWYSGEFERRRFRAHPSVVHIMDIDEHRELHALVKAPPKPNSLLLRDAIGFMEDIPIGTPRITQLGMVAVFFYEQQGSTNDDFGVCGRIALNLTAQHLIINESAQAYRDATAMGALEPLSHIPQRAVA